MPPSSVAWTVRCNHHLHLLPHWQKLWLNRVAASDAAEAAANLRQDFDTTCHPKQHAGFSGGAITWGMTFKVMSSVECGLLLGVPGASPHLWRF